MKTVDKLRQLQAEYPQLTFDNVGYQYLSIEIRESHKAVIEEIESILSELIGGFSSFNNFIPSGAVRFQYDYGHNDENSIHFIGVGYLNFEDLEGGE